MQYPDSHTPKRALQAQGPMMIKKKGSKPANMLGAKANDEATPQRYDESAAKPPTTSHMAKPAFALKKKGKK
jgi:hypothetical protein